MFEKYFEKKLTSFLDSRSHPECIHTLHDIIENVWKKIYKKFSKIDKEVLKKFWKQFDKNVWTLDSSSHPECIDTLHDIIKIFDKNFQKLTKSFEKNFEKNLTKLFGLVESSRVHRHPTWYNLKMFEIHLTKEFLKKLIIWHIDIAIAQTFKEDEKAWP
jgi:hypothetical protein